LALNDALWRQLYISDWGQPLNNDNKSLAKSNNNNNSSGKEGAWAAMYRERFSKRSKEIATFNENPSEIPGLAELQQISEDQQPKGASEKYILDFLKERRISRIARGVYLSYEDTRISGLLAAYFNTFDFTGQTVLDALTDLVMYVQFPSHFSVITKFMLFFSERYYACNSIDSIFKTTDAVYVLAFGIIMLNTDLHNPAVKNKMTLAQYIQNSRGINDGTDLPQDLLTDIYAKLKEKPLVWNKGVQPNQFDSSLWSWVSDWIAKLRR